MTKRGRTKANDVARPIRTKRDRESAAAVVKTMSGQADRESAEELRLKSLLQKMDEFDEVEDHARADSPDDEEYLGPRRRWSDD